MGYNTTIFILNDRLHEIESDPERFVKDIVRNLTQGTDRALGQTTVMRSEHADVPRLYATHGNSIIELSKWNNDTFNRYRSASPEVRAYFRERVTVAKRAISDLEKLFDMIDAEA